MMFALLTALRKSAAIALVATLSACVTVPGINSGGSTSGPQVDRAQPVPVALLVPRSDGGAGPVADSLEKAARLAAGSIQGAQIDLRVYDTGGTPAGANAAAARALSEGAQIFVGPLFSQSISAITPVVAGQNINVLSFSNNVAVAGGNVFVLGQTFDNVATRLATFAKRQGRSSVAIVHSEDLSGVAGRDAIARAARTAGLPVATVQSYPLSQQGITGAGPRIAAAIQSSGASAVFLTANVDSDLPLVATALPDNGVSPAQTQYLGLTRWSAAPQALQLPGLQGGLFALPDQQASAVFQSQYQAAYGSQPHPLAGLAFDAVQAIGSLVASGRTDALSGRALTQNKGFQGAYGPFRLRANGTNERALAVAQVQNGQVTVLDPAPNGFGRAGF